MRLFLLLIVLISVSKSELTAVKVEPISKVDFAIYPDWAHDHWVWLSSNEANQKSELEFVKGFLERNIPVGAVNIDSKWSTGVNNFVFDKIKYPDPKGMIKEFHDLGLKVIFWTTSMVDKDSSNFEEGLEKGYFLNNGSLVHWWHGQGAFIDYTNEDALDWWHEQLDQVIDIGIDGWKCDGTDPFVFELLPYAYGKNGRVTEREYSDAYYRDFFYYTRSKNPETLIMSRPVDSYGPIWWDFSPRDVMFSGWVGDQDPDFGGLKSALYNIIRSAFANYPNYGSDIGGYRTGPGELGRTKELFIRWFQMGAFVPLMENGGNKEHRPWKFDNTNETLNIYRQFVAVHQELKPYLLTAGSSAYEQETSVIKPIATPISILNPLGHSWDYLLWRDIFIAPIVEDSLVRTVKFPVGDEWVDYFNASNIYSGGSSRTFHVSLDQFPAYHRRGSMLPLYVNTNEVNHGNSLSQDHLTVLIHPVYGAKESTIVRRWKDFSSELNYEWNKEGMTFSATSHSQKVILLLRSITGCPTVFSETFSIELPNTESLEALHQDDHGIFCDTKNNQVFIRIAKPDYGISLKIHGIEMLAE